MKTNKKNIIFAMLLGVLITSLPSGVKAADEKEGGSVLSYGSEMKFASYIGSVLPEYTKIGNWSIIEDVVTLYNHNPSKIKSISAEKNVKFETAVFELGKKLTSVKSREALQWKSDLEKTAGAVRFIRNFDINSIASDNVEIVAVEAPVSFVSL